MARINPESFSDAELLDYLLLVADHLSIQAEGAIIDGDKQARVDHFVNLSLAVRRSAERLAELSESPFPDS